MRTSGVPDVVVGMYPDDHLCRPFDDFATQLEAEPAPVPVSTPWPRDVECVR